MSGKWAVILVAAGLVLATPGAGLIIAANYAKAQLGGSSLPLVALGALGCGLGLLIFTIGVAVHVFGPVAGGQAKRGYGSYTTILGSFYLALLIGNVLVGAYLVSTGAIPLSASATAAGEERSIGPSALIASSLGTELVLLAILYLRILRPRALTWPQLGLTRAGLANKIITGVAAGFVVVVASGLVEGLLALLGVRQTQWQLFAVLRQGNIWQFIAMLAIAGVLAAFVEESFFRGYVFLALSRERGLGHAFVGSALLFAAAHLPYWQSMPGLFVAGLVLAAVCYRAKSILPSMVAHGLNNVLALAIIYSTMA